MSLRDRDESDPERRAVELAQRGRIILDVSIADLEAAEAVHGAFHPIAWHFRNACNEARRSWERLRAELGTRALKAALERPPLVILPLGEDWDGGALPRAVSTPTPDCLGPYPSRPPFPASLASFERPPQTPADRRRRAATVLLDIAVPSSPRRRGARSQPPPQGVR